MCPETHPNAYSNGAYCCKQDLEKGEGKNYGESCDGGPIGFLSTCCKDDDHAKCPNGKHGQCSNYLGMYMFIAAIPFSQKKTIMQNYPSA
jgi:hypothetical protein